MRDDARHSLLLLSLSVLLYDIAALVTRVLLVMVSQAQSLQW